MAMCSPDELIDLENHWGTAYDLAFHRGEWLASRKDTHETLTASSAEGLREAIRRDYHRSPVPRDL